MDTQPEALRLAELLDDSSRTFVCKAAAELRRLHDLTQRSGDSIEELLTRIAALETLNQELLRVLDKLEYSSDGHIKRYPDESEVSAAIAKAEEMK